MVGGEVVVEAEVRPTEDVEKVKKAIANLFDGIIFQEEGPRLVRGVCDSIACLKTLHRKLRQQRILDTARSVFSRSKYGDYIEIMLNKQAAYAGKVSFVGDPAESPLGAIHVVIRHKDVDAVIDWLAPRTRHGRPLWENDMPQG